MISIIIPARNEEKYLPGCLEAISKATEHISEQIEIVVVLNRCTDNTEQVARDNDCIIARNDSKNLSMIRNEGVRISSGEVVITVDADSRMSEGMLKRILQELHSGRVIGGGVLILPDRWSAGIICTGLCIVPIALWYGISGGVFFCSREDFDAIGGFDESLCSIEDIDFARRLKAHGKKSGRKFINLYREHIVSSTRKFDAFGDWYFIKHPLQFLRLLKGTSQKDADKVWYEFKR